MIKALFVIILTFYSSHSFLFDTQIHSWDDIREWSAMLKKNITSFKIDLHFVDSDAICNYSQQSSTPCILLSHNNPQANVQYFSIDDALRFFQFHNHKYPLQIALCAKYDGDRCSQIFINIFEDVFKSIQNMSGAGKLTDIEFVLDESLVPSLKCLEDHFMPWNSTLTLHRDPDQAIDSNQGNYGRLQILNPAIGPFYNRVQPLQELYNHKPSPFGKFLSNKYAIQLWEPSDQEEISEVAQYYKELQINHQFMFATNEDPLQKKLHFSKFNDDGRYLKFGLQKERSQNQSNLLLHQFSKSITLQTFIQQYEKISINQQEYRPQSYQILSQIEFTWLKQKNQVCIQHECYNFPEMFNNKITQISISSALLIAFVTTKKQIYLSSMNFSRNLAAKKIDVGTSVSISSNLQQNMTIIAVGDSYCWNSRQFNTSSNHLLCDSDPYSMNGVMSYSYGPTQEFDAYILARSEKQYISSCDPNIMHGTLGTGYLPIINFQLNQPVVLYQAVGDICYILDASKCGCSLPQTGVNLITFPLIYQI